MKPAIRIEHLGKCYRVNHATQRGGYKTLRESLTGLATAPLQRWRQGGSCGDTEPFWALKDVSFDVQPGEVVGIIGRNGAGKSTLLKILSRITKPSTGRVTLNGRVASLLEVGTGFHPELTGRENIYLNGSILGMKRGEIQRKFDEIVAFAEVEKFLDTPVKRYSSGMYVRLAFAVAAHLEPEILIVDEVLAVGDAEFQRKCLGKMKDISRGGRTVLFVSHNMSAVEAMCNRVSLLHQGKTLFDGPSRSGVQTYLTSRPCGHKDGVFRRTAAEIASFNTCIVEAMVLSDQDFCGGGYQTGTPLEFVIRCTSHTCIRRTRVGIFIDSSKGQRIVTLHTEHCSGTIRWQSISGDATFRCRPDLPALMPDTYSIKLSLEDGREVIDSVEDAFHLVIEEADLYGNAGKRHRGVLLCPEQWVLDT
jgi:lipopolysaccharide transport system ATP-binding protein